MRMSRRNVTIAAMCALLGGVLLARAFGGDSPPPGPVPEAVSDVEVETTSTRAPDDAAADPDSAGLPPNRVDESPLDLDGGFPQTELGAREAAVFYLEGTEEAVDMSPSEAAAAQRAIATASYADAFEADTEQRMLDLTAAIPNGIVVRIAPIEALSTADGADWLISIWYAQAITIADETVVDDWRTVHYRMQWEDETWKIADFRSERGPMPGRGSQPPSASPGQFEAILTGFTDEGL